MPVYIENWYITRRLLTKYSAPETGFMTLSGEVYGHPNFIDGEQVITSRLKELNIQVNKAKTSYTEYTLGNPAEDFLVYLKENNYKLEDYSLER